MVSEGNDRFIEFSELSILFRLVFEFIYLLYCASFAPKVIYAIVVMSGIQLSHFCLSLFLLHCNEIVQCCIS